MIRPYRDTDLEALLDVWYAASSLAHPFLEEDFMTQERKNIRDIYIPNTKTWIYEEAGTLLGFIGMIDNEVGAIFVRPDKYGQGIGRQLLDLVAIQHPSLEVEVFKANSIGRGFYDKYGFVLLQEHIHEATNQPLLRLSYTP